MASSSLGWEEGTLEHTEDLNCSPQALQGWQAIRREERVSMEGWALITGALESRDKDPQWSSLRSVGWTLGRENFVVFLSQIPFLFSWCHIKKNALGFFVIQQREWESLSKDWYWTFYEPWWMEAGTRFNLFLKNKEIWWFIYPNIVSHKYLLQWLKCRTALSLG